MNSHEIESEINLLVTKLSTAVYEEFKGLAAIDLLRESNSNKSGWSGGHSVTNMVEQIKRNEALSLLGWKLRGQ